MEQKRLSTIEDLMIAALKAASDGVGVETRSVALTEGELKKMLGKAPFIYIEYGGGSRISTTESGRANARRSEFNLYVAAKSLRSKQDAQRGSYDLLETNFNTLDGNILNDPAIGRAGPFAWSSEAPVFVDEDGGTVYMSVFTLIESIT